MKRVFGECEGEYEANVLRDHQRCNCNTPVIFDSDTIGGLYWPNLRTKAWEDPGLLAWTKTLRGKEKVASLLDDLNAIIRRSNDPNRAYVASETRQQLDKSCRESELAVMHAYNEKTGSVTLVTEEKESGPRALWKALFLVDSGRENAQVCKMCPAIAAFVRQIPRRCGDAFISAIAPGAKIRLHRGPTNTKLTAHFGLIIPAGDCGLRVGTETRKWKVGEWLLFNDSYPHEAWNHSSEVRYVLIVDVWAPQLTDAEIRALSIMRDERDDLYARDSTILDVFPLCCRLPIDDGRGSEEEASKAACEHH
eukprot:g166.t1